MTDGLMKDFQYGCRRWLHHRAIAAMAVLILACGTGATTAVFSVVDAVLLRPPPWKEPDRLVVVHAVLPEQRGNPAFSTTWNRSPISWGSWDDLRHASAFADVAVWYSERQILTAPRTEFAEVMHVSSSLLPLLGVQPILGRAFSPDKDLTISDEVILSYDAWQRHFGGTADVIGQTIALRSTPPDSPRIVKSVVGVLPRGFRFQSETPDFVLPIGLMAWNGSFEVNHFLRAVARLAPGVSLDAASAIAEPLVRRHESSQRRSARLQSLIEDQFGHAVRPLWMMLAGAALLLLVACSNVAALLLGEARVRRHEMAVRVAMGANRARLLRQLAVEQAVLTSLAGVAGLMLAAWLIPVLIAMAPEGLAGIEGVQLNLRVGIIALVANLATAFTFGIVPMLIFSATPAATALSEGGRQSTLRGSRGQRAIVVSQLALAVVLLVSASLFGESVIRLRSRPLGFEPARLGVVAIGLTEHPGFVETPSWRGFGSPLTDRLDARLLFTRQLQSGWIHTAALIDRLSGLPGIASVAGASAAPLSGRSRMIGIRPEGQPPQENQTVPRQFVTEGYFETLGISVLRGRSFNSSDRQGPPVVVISSEASRRFFAGHALGKRLVSDTVAYAVIGVVANAKHYDLSDDDLATVYVLNQSAASVTHLLVRTSTDAAAAMAAVRDAIGQFDRSVVVTSTTTMEKLLEQSLAQERFRARMSVAFGLAALTLAAIGLYGVAARSVADRRLEIGVRMALGAGPEEIRALVFRDAGIIVTIGLLLGLPASYGVSLIIRSLLYGVSATPLHVFALSSAVLAIAAFAAVAIPAHRAGRLDPLVALRS